MCREEASLGAKCTSEMKSGHGTHGIGHVSASDTSVMLFFVIRHCNGYLCKNHSQPCRKKNSTITSSSLFSSLAAAACLAAPTMITTYGGHGTCCCYVGTQHLIASVSTLRRRSATLPLLVLCGCAPNPYRLCRAM